MRRYIVFAAALAALYGLNRFFLIPATGGALRELLAWHGADLLAGGMMLCIVNSLLALVRRPPLRRFWAVSAYLLGCGLFWEVVTPLYLARSVGDPRDLAAYWLGGMAVWCLERKRASG